MRASQVGFSTGVEMKLTRILAALTLVVAVGGCSSNPTVGADATLLTGLTVGDCTGVQTNGSTASTAKLPCNQPHHWEVASIVPVAADTYPGKALLLRMAHQNCPAAFTSYVGVDPTYSSFTPTYLAPAAEHWSNPDSRRLVCMVGTGEVTISRSLKGSRLAFPEVGQCVDKAGKSELRTPLVPCDKPHNYEVFSAQAWTGKKAPTPAQRDSLYQSACVAGFKKFVGVADTKSKYEPLMLAIPSASWTTVPDHRIICAAGSPTIDSTGSLKNAKA